MNRRGSREQAFKLLFQNCFTGEKIDDIIENTKICEDVEINDFVLELCSGVVENKESLDKYIEENVKGWKIDRISRVSLTIMRMSIYEMFFSKSVPIEISINEAVELSKKYGCKDEFSYVNGVLGSIYKKNISNVDKDI